MTATFSARGSPPCLHASPPSARPLDTPRPGPSLSETRLSMGSAGPPSWVPPSSCRPPHLENILDPRPLSRCGRPQGCCLVAPLPGPCPLQHSFMGTCHVPGSVLGALQGAQPTGRRGQPRGSDRGRRAERTGMVGWRTHCRASNGRGQAGSMQGPEGGPHPQVVRLRRAVVPETAGRHRKARSAVGFVGRLACRPGPQAPQRPPPTRRP